MTEEELVEDSMFQEKNGVSVRVLNGEAFVSDEQTLTEMEFAEACDEYIRAARKFEKLDRFAKAQKGIPDNLCEWFDALEEQYQADKRLWLLFVGKDRSRQSNLLYCEFRSALMSSRKLRADA